MSPAMSALLSGAMAMCALAIAVHFLKFWRSSKDRLFAFFAAAFFIEFLSRLMLGLVRPTEETEPLVYLPRLLMFGLIAFAILQKNRARR